VRVICEDNQSNQFRVFYNTGTHILTYIYAPNNINPPVNTLYSSSSDFTIINFRVKEQENGTYAIIWKECSSIQCFIIVMINGSTYVLDSYLPSCNGGFSLTALNSTSWMACWASCSQIKCSRFLPLIPSGHGQSYNSCKDGERLNLFICVDGIWQIYSSVIISVNTSWNFPIIINGNLVINGNLNTSDVLNIDGNVFIEGDIIITEDNFKPMNISGCANIHGNLEIHLTNRSQLNNTLDVLYAYSNCTGFFNSVNIVFTHDTLDNCQTVQTTQRQKEHKLEIIYTLENTPCGEPVNTLEWWKILLMVLVPILFIIVAVWALQNENFRNSLFPFRDEPIELFKKY